MLKNYTTSPIDSTGKEIAIVSIILCNPTSTTKTAHIKVVDTNGVTKSNILGPDSEVAGKETLVIDGKIFLSAGDKLEFSGVDFTFSGNEDNDI